MIIGSTYNLSTKVYDYPVIFNNKSSSKTSSFECLDENLKWDEHIKNILKSRIIAISRRARHFIPADALQMIYNALIQPYFDYCSPLWQTTT